MISTLVLNRTLKKFSINRDHKRISDLRANTENVLWVDVENPSAQEFSILQEEFGFHHLAIEDCQHPHQRPKIEDFHGYYFIVLYNAALTEQNELELTELNIFLGTNYVVTLHRQPIQALARGERLWRNWTDVEEQGAGVLAYLMMDTIVDEYFPVLDAISDQMDDVEDALFSNSSTQDLENIFRLKKQLLQLRRTVTPLRDVFNILLRREQPIFSREVQYYFQNIFDHLIRVADQIDSLRDLLGSTMDVYLSIQSNRMNMVMKRLTALSTILMSAALIAGIYGMNFVNLPEKDWYYGYYYSLGLMGAVSLGLLIFFRWIKWL